MAETCNRDKKYLFHFANDFSEFRIPEIESIAEAHMIALQQRANFSEDCPFKVYSNLEYKDIGILARRSVSLRAIYEYCGEASSLDTMLDGVKVFAQTNPDRQKSFKVTIEAFNRTYTNRTKLKLEMIELIADALDMTGPVNLSNPEIVFSLFEYYGPHGSNPPDEALKLFFGKLVMESNREKDLRKFSLKSRHFIGNTSMDPTLSFLMANMAKAGETSLVLDPFVGTGSLLLSCAHHGAYVMGMDINQVLLHGRGRSSRHKQKWRERDESVRSNFVQYGMASQYIDILISDASKHSIWSIDGIFDALITDPPYGIREQTKKLEAPSAGARKPPFMPPTSQYHLSDVFNDLLTLASRCLRLRGRLVYWLPIHRPDYTPNQIPSHPCFRLISNCEQTISTHISRRLITMEKVCEPHQLTAEDLVAVASHSDHYKESFRDRYFHITAGIEKTTLDS